MSSSDRQLDLTDTPTSRYLAELAESGHEERPNPRKSSLLAIGVIVIGFIAAFIPIVYFGLPIEVAKWHFAAAQESYLDGDLDKAISALDKCLEHKPDWIEVHLARAQFHSDSKLYKESLDDLDRASKCSESDRPNIATLIKMRRADAFQHLGQHKQAVALWKEIKENASGTPYDRATALNALAYARALANTETEEAFEDIQEAIRLQGPLTSFVDTRGFIQYRRGNLEEAFLDLDQAVREAEDGLKVSSSSKIAQQTSDPRVLAKYIEARERELAVLIYHRALLLKRQQKSAEAKQDLARIEELGYEPGDHLF